MKETSAPDLGFQEAFRDLDRARVVILEKQRGMESHVSVALMMNLHAADRSFSLILCVDADAKPPAKRIPHSHL